VAEEQRVPVEELVTPERTDELAVAFFRKHGGGDYVGNPIANMTVFFTEQRRRIYPEDELRLSEQYPKSVPSSVLAEAIKQRMKRERL
jgi:hypothetical protein